MNVSKAEIDEFRAGLLSWGDGRLREFPWRTTDDPYQVLVAEILLQQTLASKVEPVYAKFVDRYPKPADLLNVEPATLAELLDPLGFQNIRANALIENARSIEEVGMPTDEEGLSELEYVGRYGANATLCFGYGERQPIVDANVIRGYNRYFGFDFENAQDDRAWEFAERMLPEEGYERFNLALLDFAAAVCTARTPGCGECLLNESCSHAQPEVDWPKQ